MPLPAGTRLGRYEVRSQLGAGGMGEVYLAWDSGLERNVALKVLPQDVASDRQRMNRFIQEARAASALNHPNILSIHDVGEAESTRFIVTEYVEGETLRQRLSAGRMDVREALSVATQVASALSEAHAAGIVHRDIKPENVMLRRGGIVKVLDFGIAKLAERRPTAADTQAPTKALIETAPGVIVGTVSYMSPEQARGLEVDARTDVWSLGVLLYEMVAWRLPFEGETATDVLSFILHREPQSLLLHRKDVPEELERIVEKALTKDREERYQVVKDMALDLKRLRQRLDLEAEIERSGTLERGAEERRSAAEGGHPAEGTERVAQTGGAAEVHTTSSAEYIVTEIKRHKLGAMLVLTALVLAAVAVAYLAYSRYTGGAGGEAVRSVAVLPFQNVGGDPEMEYLSDGISESLINSLSRLPQLKVIARSSSFNYKDKNTDSQEVARALGVEAVVSGRVVRVGDQLRVSAEMVDARDRTQMWGEQYNRKAGDLLAVQSEISREITDKLRLRLTTGQQQQLAKREAANPQAYELLLKGRFYDNKGGIEDKKKAVEYYRQAIAVDPAYALAYAALSLSYNDLIGHSSVDPKEFWPRAEAAARKALEFEETLDEAHLALAYLKTNDWEWEEAEREFKRTLELNPNHAWAHAVYSGYLSNVGRHEQAIAEMKRAKELNPLSLATTAEFGFALYKARKYDQAIEALKKALELDRNFPLTHYYLALAYAAKGMSAEAIAEYQETIRLGVNTSGTQIYLGAAYAQAGERGKAQMILKWLETSGEYVSPGELPVLYVALGEHEQAFASLEKAYSAHDQQLQYLGVEPAFDPLRSDPRFQDLVRKVGLPQ